MGAGGQIPGLFSKPLLCWVRGSRALRFRPPPTHTLCHLQGPPFLVFLARKMAFLSELHPLGLLPAAVYGGCRRPLRGEERGGRGGPARGGG